MWKMSKSLAAVVFAAAWWGIFYPELCFSEETCAVVQTENAQEEIDAAAVWRASGDEIVIRSKLWEWCAENLFDASETSAESAPAGRRLWTDRKNGITARSGCLIRGSGD